MNIRKDKLVRCAEGLGVDYDEDAVRMEDWWVAWDTDEAPILLTYAPGGIMDKMGWEFYYDVEEEYYVLRCKRYGALVKEYIENYSDIPAATIDAYLNTLGGKKKENDIKNMESYITSMKTVLANMDAELKRLKEGG